MSDTPLSSEQPAHTPLPLIHCILQERGMDLWVNSEPSLRVFGRCKYADTNGDIKARLCNSPSPLAYVCLSVSQISPDQRLHSLSAVLGCEKVCILCGVLDVSCKQPLLCTHLFCTFSL